MTAGNFASRLAKTRLATKADIAAFVKDTDFDDKLNNINKKLALNKANHVLA